MSDEDGDQAGYDIAVITLPAIAPAGAERFELYTNRDEVGQEVTFVGYGRTGQGSTGEDLGPPDTAGVRRAGINTIDAISQRPVIFKRTSMMARLLTTCWEI